MDRQGAARGTCVGDEGRTVQEETGKEKGEGAKLKQERKCAFSLIFVVRCLLCASACLQSVQQWGSGRMECCEQQTGSALSSDGCMSVSRCLAELSSSSRGIWC